MLGEQVSYVHGNFLERFLVFVINMGGWNWLVDLGNTCSISGSVERGFDAIEPKRPVPTWLNRMTPKIY
jgi:hypothetical protein